MIHSVVAKALRGVRPEIKCPPTSSPRVIVKNAPSPRVREANFGRSKRHVFAPGFAKEGYGPLAFQPLKRMTKRRMKRQFSARD